MNIKLIGLDLDGTTLNDLGKMSQRTYDALEKAHEKGVHIVIATGRNYFAMPKEFANMPFIEYTVNSNGAEIRKFREDKTVYEAHMAERDVILAHEIIKKLGYMVEAFVDGVGYINQRDFDDIREGKVAYRTVEYVLQTRSTVEDIYKFILENKNKIENINIFVPSDEDKRTVLRELKKLKSSTVTSSLKENIEIGGYNVSKASAIGHIADMLGVKKHEIMCCGDSLNDLEMIRFAGLSVAVNNAADEIKNSAMYITDTNDRDGVAKAVEKFVLRCDEKLPMDNAAES